MLQVLWLQPLSFSPLSFRVAPKLDCLPIPLLWEFIFNTVAPVIFQNTSAILLLFTHSFLRHFHIEIKVKVPSLTISLLGFLYSIILVSLPFLNRVEMVPIQGFWACCFLCPECLFSIWFASSPLLDITSYVWLPDFTKINEWETGSQVNLIFQINNKYFSVSIPMQYLVYTYTEVISFIWNWIISIGKKEKKLSYALQLFYLK